MWHMLQLKTNYIDFDIDTYFARDVNNGNQFKDLK